MDEKDKNIADQAKRIIKLVQLVEKLLLRISKLEKNSNTPPRHLGYCQSDQIEGADGEIIKPGVPLNTKGTCAPPFEPSEVDSEIDIAFPLKEQVCSCGSVLIRSQAAPRWFQQAAFTERGIPTPIGVEC